MMNSYTIIYANMQICVRFETVTWPAKMDQVGIQKLTIFPTSLNCIFSFLYAITMKCFRESVEFNKEAFAAYRNRILHTEAEVYMAL